MINLTVVIDNEEAVRKFRELQRAAKNTTSSIVTDSERMDIALRKLGSALGKIGVGFSLGSLVRQIAQTRGEFQQLESAFTTLLQSKEKADSLMKQMVNLAATTPFDLQGVADGARQLLAYGFAADDITDTLTRLGNVAAGLGLPLERLTYLYGTTATQGRVYARDMLQFTGSGIPVLREMAKMYGKTTEEINAMVSAGKIGFEDVKRVIESMTNAGGQFYNLMENQSKTISGLISNLGDALDTMFNEMGKSQEGFITTTLQGAISLVENYEKVLDILIPLVAAYGAYKVALITTAAVQKVTVTVETIQRFYQLAKGVQTAAQAQRLFNLAVKSNPIGLALGAISGIIAAVGIFSKRTNEATRAIGAQEQAVIDEGRQVNELVLKLTTANTKEDERRKALEELKRIQPAIVEGLDAESLATENLTRKVKEYNDELVTRIALAAKEDVVTEATNKQMSIGAKIKENDADINRILLDIQQDFLSKKIKKLGPNGSVLFDWKEISEEEKQRFKDAIDEIIASNGSYYQKADAIIRLFPSDTHADRRNTFAYTGIDFKGLTDAFSIAVDLQDQFGKAQQEVDKAKEEVENFRQTFKQIFNSQGGDGESAVENLTKLSELLSEIESTEAKLKKLHGQTSWSDKDKDDIKTETENLKNLKAQYKELTGTEYGKTGDKAKDALKRQKDLADAILSADLDLQRARIAIMQEGRNKRLAEIDLEYQQTMARINKNRADAAKNGATGEQMTVFDEQVSLAGQKRLIDRERVNKEYYTDWASTYHKLGDAFLSEEKRKQKATEKIYQEMRNKNLDDLLAGNITGTQYIDLSIRIDDAETKAELDAQVERYQVYLEERTRIEEAFESEVASLRKSKPHGYAEDEVEQRRRIRDAELQELEDRLGITEDSFTAFVDSLIYKSTDELLTLIETAQSELNKLGKDGDPAKRAEQQKRLNAAQNALKRQQGNNNTKDATTPPSSGTIKKWAELQEVLKGVCGEFDEIGEAIGGTAGEAIKAAGEIAACALELVDSIATVASGSAQAIENTSTTASTAVQNVERASVILAIISAALQLATKIAQLFTKDHELSEETIKSYEAYMDATDDLIDKQKELLEVMTGVQALMASEAGVEAIKKQEEATRNLGKAYLASRAKNKHSYGYKTEKKLSGYKDEIEAAGFDWSQLRGTGRMEGLFDLSASEIERFKHELPEVWAKLDEDTRKYLDTLIECGEKMDELGEATAEALTGFSLDDARDELLEFLDDMDATFDDVAENFQTTMMHAINRVIASQLDERLMKWYDDFSTAMEDGVLSDAERKQLQKEYENIYTDALRKREAAYDMAGINPEADIDAQSAAARGFQAMSQETGDELNGRFTAIQGDVHDIKSVVLQALVNGISQLNETINIRDIMIQLHGNVADIRTYTRVLPEMSETLTAMNRKLSDL